MSERILVIGGTRGTGLLVTQLLVREGAHVRVLARDPRRAERLVPRAAERVTGDITQPHTLPRAFEAVDHVIFTAGVTTRVATETLVRNTEFVGVQNILAAASTRGLRGQFVYMTSLGVATPSLSGSILNLVKGNTLTWRYRAEQEIRASGLTYTIVRAGLLSNAAGRHAIVVAQRNLPLALKYRIARADVAECLVAALKSPDTRRTTFEVVWGPGDARAPWATLFRTLVRDPAPTAAPFVESPARRPSRESTRG